MPSIDFTIMSILQDIQEKELLKPHSDPYDMISGEKVFDYLRQIDGFPRTKINSNGHPYIENGQGEALELFIFVEFGGMQHLWKYCPVDWRCTVYNEDDHYRPLRDEHSPLDSIEDVEKLLRYIVNWTGLDDGITAIEEKTDVASSVSEDDIVNAAE